jgi:hypothetical protein
MDLGFETCGNATLIVYDRGTPVLVTDPWITESQYFGSWALPYRFTAGQLEAFSRVRYVWLSHGHPDHLNLASLERFRDRIILVPQHHGGRISADLKAAGFRVQDLSSGAWLELSHRVRILSAADWNQDAAVLIALGENCAVLNLNDGGALGTRATLLSSLKPFRRRFVLGLINYGDADMMNYFTEGGERVTPLCADKRPLGHQYSGLLRDWDGTHTAPFSCHHMYARSDSCWASAYETPLEAHGERFNSARGEFIPGYFSYEADADRIAVTPAQRVARSVREPEEFGDNWSEPLEPEDVRALQTYFARFEHLRESFEFVNFRVGGRDNVVALGGPRQRGITFEAPRTSLMNAMRYEIFDDLMIANFVRTTLHGGVRSLYPDFTPYVAKYGDNGRAFSNAELARYFAFYGRASGLPGWLERLRVDSAHKVRNALSANRAVYLRARRLYRYLRA